MRLLIVEDERRLALSLARGLRAEGYSVDVAHDGREGLFRAGEEDYDLILLDVMLPGVSGYRVASTLRRDGVQTPILMLTAKDGEYDEAEGLDCGADDYLTKPFSYLVLRARIRALLRRRQRAGSLVIEIGDLRVDPAGQRVHRGPAEVAVTSREFAVLEYLAAHAEEVVSKRRILDHVWDSAYDGDPNVVEVHVSALRRKVDAPFGRRSIETVRGSGYRLTAGKV
ncbi:DNA-binding response OmpR family regulator [Actinocorallia herbida]|uniref:DNA-binding response OmpR family regulator n=1 Tax=Actinocorallia herbida TaxID=58109 RepID=A0A3N1D6J0_9ACTN|nr:response regulator transcription factor [Actinocorallia herbida]ROO89142.1 DNA-binding response OmpR family regulator [Actinocorallia herbida]